MSWRIGSGPFAALRWVVVLVAHHFENGSRILKILFKKKIKGGNRCCSMSTEDDSPTPLLHGSGGWLVDSASSSGNTASEAPNSNRNAEIQQQQPQQQTSTHSASAPAPSNAPNAVQRPPESPAPASPARPSVQGGVDYEWVSFSDDVRTNGRRILFRPRILNPHLVCLLCMGYFREAHTIRDCLHSCTPLLCPSPPLCIHIHVVV